MQKRVGMETSKWIKIHNMVHIKLVSINSSVEMIHSMYFNVVQEKEGQTKRRNKRPEKTAYKELQNL
jgi:hypothetical protein